MFTVFHSEQFYVIVKKLYRIYLHFHVKLFKAMIDKFQNETIEKENRNTFI